MSTNQSNNLRPCPFCGKIPKPDWTDESYIECTNRKCSVYGYGMSTGDWNTRPIEDELRKRIAELESAQRWTPVQDIKVGEIYLIDGYDEWDSDRGTEVLDGFTIAKYYGIEDSCRVFADFYGTFLRFDMESDDLRNVYRLPEGA